jgi:hypothetical protein
MKMTKSKAHFKILTSDLRTVAGLTLTFASLVALLMLASCAPKPVERVYPVAKTNFGPIQKDPDLKLDKAQTYSVDASKLKWKETVNSARVFRFAEAMISLGQLKQSPQLKSLGEKVGNAFYSAKGTATKSDLTSTLFISAAVGETKDETMPLLDKNDKMLAEQLPIIRSILKATSTTFDWPTPETPPREALTAARAYATHFLDVASDSRVDHDVYEGIASAFDTDFYPLIDGMASEIDSILEEKTSITMIDRLKALVKKYDFKLSPDTDKQMTQARSVFEQIDSMSDSQDALTVIIQLWEMTDPDNRSKTFKPVSEELYGFLKGKGPHDLACLRGETCLNPLILIPKKMVLLPAIEKYGIAKLKVDITAAAHDALVKQISAAVASFVPTIPDELDKKVTDQLTQIRKKISAVKSDYPAFIKSIAREYETQNLKVKKDDEIQIAGIEASKVNIALESGSVVISASEKTSTPSTGSEVIGASMAYAASIWKTSDPQSVSYQKSVISQVDKLLAIGGFQTANKKPYPSLAVSLDPALVDKHLNVRHDVGGPTPFAVPDLFMINQDLTPNFNDGGKNVSIRGQAELLRGLAAMTRYFRDWEKNDFDKSLGTVQVGKLIKELPAGSVTAKLFPKDSFFALSIANSATILTNITKQMSTMFLIDITKHTKWANERGDEDGDSDDQPATMAAPVDILAGQRISVVHTADAARLLLAIADFLDATEGIEKTQASPLITPNSEGKRSIDQLIEARSSLSMLIMGIGNFISHEMQTTDGGIRATYHRDLMSANAKEPRRAADQALCILAMLKAGDVMGKDMFNWPALDAYAFMNKKLFNPSTGFYRALENTPELPSPDEIAIILQAGETLRSHMSDASRSQWDKLSTPWVKALEELN